MTLTHEERIEQTIGLLASSGLSASMIINLGRYNRHLGKLAETIEAMPTAAVAETVALLLAMKAKDVDAVRQAVSTLGNGRSLADHFCPQKVETEPPKYSAEELVRRRVAFNFGACGCGRQLVDLNDFRNGNVTIESAEIRCVGDAASCLSTVQAGSGTGLAWKAPSELVATIRSEIGTSSSDYYQLETRIRYAESRRYQSDPAAAAWLKKGRATIDALLEARSNAEKAGSELPPLRESLYELAHRGHMQWTNDVRKLHREFEQIDAQMTAQRDRERRAAEQRGEIESAAKRQERKSSALALMGLK